MKVLNPRFIAKVYTILLVFVSFSVINNHLLAQEDELIYDDHIYRESIKTPMIHPKGITLGYPFIELNGMKLQVRFDDMDADYKDFYYTIVHCNSNWELSDLDKNDYIQGFYSNPIDDYEQSFNTMVSFTHYQFEIPNEMCRIKLSGNYLLKVYEDDDEDDLVLTRRFIVYENQVSIIPVIKECTKIADLRYNQEVDVTVVHESFEITNAYDSFSITLLQNGRWDNAKQNLPPRFVKNNILDFDYGDENVFEGGNEFRDFDIKDMDYVSLHVRINGIIDRQWHSWLKSEPNRAFKTYRSDIDINGKYFIRNDDGFEANLEEEYVLVHFDLPYDGELLDEDIYVFGSLSDRQYKENFKMEYNKESKKYEAEIMLKQGLYNYIYLSKSENETVGNNETVEGNHFETENDYHVIAYYHDFFDGYDRVLGIVIANNYKSN